MGRYTPGNIPSGFGANTAINNEFDKIEAAINDTLSRVGDAPNPMEADLDMNSNDVLNVRQLDAEYLTVQGLHIVPDETFVSDLPIQAGNDGKALFTDGTTTAWKEAPLVVGTVTELTALTNLADGATIIPLGVSEVNDMSMFPYRFVADVTPPAEDPVTLHSDDLSGYFVTSHDGTINIKRAGAVGDNSTIDQTAVANAVAYCYANNLTLYWPDGDYVTTGSIPNLHDVRHKGLGRIKRDGNTFYVDPRYNQDNTIFVDASAADDLGDGLSVNDPIKTLNRTSSILANYGPVLQSKWTIDVAAGNYGGVIYTRKFMTLGPNGLVTIRGPSNPVQPGAAMQFIVGGTFGLATVGETITGGTSGFTATVTSRTNGLIRATLVSGTPERLETVTGGTSGLSGPLFFFGVLPTAVILQSEDLGKESGLVFGWHQQVAVQDIRSSGFTASGGAGIDARKFCDIRLTNFWDNTSFYGASFQEHVTYTMAGCCFTVNGSNGITELFGITRNIQGAKSVVHAAAGSGLNSKEMCCGHMDDLISNLNGEAGIEFHSYVTANVGGLELYNNPVAASLTDSEVHVETAIVFGTGADANTRKYVLLRGSQLSRSGWSNSSLTFRALPVPQSRFLDTATHTVTGTTSSQDYSLDTLYANEHATKGQTVKVIARGKRTTGSNGTATFQLRVGGVNCSTVILPTTSLANSAFEIEFEILCHTDGDFQRFFGKGWQEGASGAVTGEAQTQDRTETWVANDKAVVLRFTPGHASDSIDINDIRMYA